MFFTVLPLPWIFLQVFLLSLSIAIEAIVLQQKLRLTRKQSIEFSISINLLSAIVLWLVFFVFQILAPEQEKLHILSIIFFNNLHGLDRWTTIYPVLTIIATMMFILIFFVEFKALQLLQEISQFFYEHREPTPTEFMVLINRINTTLFQSDAETSTTVFQANLFSHIVTIAMIIFLNVYRGE